jgi:hypothetical protein
VALGIAWEWLKRRVEKNTANPAAIITTHMRFTIPSYAVSAKLVNSPIIVKIIWLIYDMGIKLRL